jgi:hypothetical protein
MAAIESNRMSTVPLIPPALAPFHVIENQWPLLIFVVALFEHCC